VFYCGVSYTKICHYRWKKSTKPLESKMRLISLGINQSCSNRFPVHIISQLYTFRKNLQAVFVALLANTVERPIGTSLIERWKKRRHKNVADCFWNNVKRNFEQRELEKEKTSAETLEQKVKIILWWRDCTRSPETSFCRDSNSCLCGWRRTL
jgi:hypothetical protein